MSDLLGEVSLAEISNKISYGYTASATSKNTGVKFLRITDIVPERIDWESVPFCEISESDYQKYKINTGDILIARTGATTGYNKTITNLPYPAVYASYLIKYDLHTENVSPYFVKYILQSSLWYDYVSAVSGGSAQPGANAKVLGSFKFSLPPLPEQKAIASVLSALDDKIDLLQRQNQTLEQMAATLFRQWFIEEAKEDWEKGYLKDAFHFVMGQSPKGDSFNDTGIGIAMFQGNADFGFRFPKERIYTTEPTRFAEPLDTLISVRAPVGAQNMAKVKCCIGRGVAAFRHIKNTDWYTYTYFKLNYLMVEIKKFNDEGTVFGSISKSDFEKIEVVIPDENTILEFEKMAKPLNEKINLNCHAISNLTSLRDTLLPKLISGEVRLKGFEPVS